MKRASPNHSYRPVWSDVYQAHVAVAENGTARGKRTAIAAAITLALGSGTASAHHDATTDVVISADRGAYSTTSNVNVTVNKGVTVTGATQALGVHYRTATDFYTHNILNHGTLITTHDGTINDHATGLGSYFGDGGTLTNSGTITVTNKGVNSAYGITAHSIGTNLSSTTLTNSGAISVTNSDASTGTSHGIWTRWIKGTLTNSGTITVTGARGNAYGIGTNTNELMATGALANSGSITVTNAHASGTTHGIDVGLVSGALTNSGTITVTTTNSTAGATATSYGIKASNFATGGTLSNSGTIIASSSAPAGSAYSLYVANTGTGGTINNQTNGKLIGGMDVKQTTVAFNNHGAIILKNGVDLSNINGTGTPVNGTIAGNYNQSSTGVLHIAVSGAGNGGYSKLTVGGTATIAGTAYVDVKSANTLAVGQTLAGVVSAGTRSGNFASVADNSALFDFTSKTNGNALDFEITKATTVEEAVTRTNPPATESTPAPAPTTDSAPAPAPVRRPVGTNAARVLDGLIDSGGGTSDMRTVITALGRLETDRQVSNAVMETLPTIHHDATASMRNTLSDVSNIVQARLDQQAGRSSGNHFVASKHVWLKPFGSSADQDDHNGVAGYKSKSHGIVLGADGDLASGSRVGLAFGHSKTDVTSNPSIVRQNADITSYQLIAYGAHNLPSGMELNLQADIGHHSTEGTRHIGFITPNRVARSDFNSLSAHLGASMRKSFAVSDATRIIAALRADYTHIRNKGYQESGADALNLNVDRNKTDAFVLGVDGAVTHALNDRVSLSANAGVGYDLINERASITAAYAGASSATFSTEGMDPRPLVLRGGLGLTGKVSDTMTVTVRYDAEGRKKFTNQTASVNLRWAF